MFEITKVLWKSRAVTISLFTEGGNEKEDGEGKNIDRAIFSREKEIMKKREGKVLPTFFLLQNLYYALSIID